MVIELVAASVAGFAMFCIILYYEIAEVAFVI